MGRFYKASSGRILCIENDEKLTQKLKILIKKVDRTINKLLCLIISYGSK